MSDITHWLSELGLEKYDSVFSKAEIDFETLPYLVEEDLKELGLPLGPRLKIWRAIRRLNKANVIADLENKITGMVGRSKGFVTKFMGAEENNLELADIQGLRKLAEERGNAKAKFELGDLYERGHGVLQDQGPNQSR
jgi:hypothetical protein